MNYETWAAALPLEITGDCLWKVEAYRLALFASDLSWRDVTKLANDRRTRELSGQLYQAVGSVDANISEGYSRGGGRDRARFYEYALGSARESRGWYFKGRYILGSAVFDHRTKLITQIIRLLLPMIRDQRTSGAFLHEESASYIAEAQFTNLSGPGLSTDIDQLLQNIPLP